MITSGDYIRYTKNKKTYIDKVCYSYSANGKTIYELPNKSGVDEASILSYGSIEDVLENGDLIIDKQLNPHLVVTVAINKTICCTNSIIIKPEDIYRVLTRDQVLDNSTIINDIKKNESIERIW